MFSSTGLSLSLIIAASTTALAFPVSTGQTGQLSWGHRQDSLDPYPNQAPISFKDSKFTLAIISDTHLLDNQVDGNVTQLNAQSADAVKTYLQAESPNYVVHLGDLVSGEAASSAEDVRLAVRQILQPMVDAGIPFSTTKGNHDNDKYSTHKSITEYERELSSELSYTGIAPEELGGDTASDTYWVPVYPSSSSERGSKPALLLWFFDSRSGHTMLGKSDPNPPDWVDPAVGGWITSEAGKMTAQWGETLPPSIIFVHVPSHDFAVAQQSAPYSSQVGGVANETASNFTSSNLKYPGINDDKPLAGQAAEGRTYNGEDRAYLDAFFGSALSKSRIHAIVSGHQHGADWCAPASNLTAQNGQAVPVCFAKHSGFGGYDYDNWAHGTRLFKFDLDTVDKQSTTVIKTLEGQSLYETTMDSQWGKE